jgi:hypothetical protein
MKRVRSLVFHTINTPDIAIAKREFLDIVTGFRFNENLGFGLSIQESSEDPLLIKVVKRTATFINDYDDSLNEFVRKQIFVFSDFQFCVDFDLNVIYAFGGLSHINYVKYILRNILKTEFSLVPVELNVHSFYQMLLDKQIDIKIEHITINHFNFQNELVGRFSGSVLNQNVASSLLENYKADVVKVSFLIRISDNEQFILHVLPNGALKFLSDAEDVEYLTDYLKNIIFSKNG